MVRLTRAQVRQVDRLAALKYRIPEIVLMENAARAGTEVAMEMLASAAGRRVLILCGGGNNGGDGLAMARHLHNHACEISIMHTTDPEKYAGEARVNWEIVRAMGLKISPIDPAAVEREKWDLIVDAIFGTGLSQAPRDPFGQIANAVGNSARPVLAVDIPSGMDCDTGEPLGECIAATRTITFVAEKIGFANPRAKEFLGQVIVGDIGCPRELIEQVVKERSA